MKTSIDHLPEKAKEELNGLVEYILEDVPETQFIILYGSYARGEQIEYDQRTEFGLRTCFMSDYDIVVLTPKELASNDSVMRKLRNSASKYASGYNLLIKPTVQFLAMHLEEFNQGIADCRYFYSDIRKEGIVLYSSGKYEIEQLRKPNFQQIYNLSKEYFDEKYSRAESFLYAAKSVMQINDYRMAAFQLHQAVENYLLAAILTSSLYAPKEHNILRLLEQSTLWTNVAAEVFHTRTGIDKHLLDLLEKSYVQARYNKDFLVTQKDIEGLLAKIEQLRIDIKTMCLSKVEEHKQNITQDNV